MLTSNVSARVDHELKRNIILSASAAAGRDEYQGVDRDDDRKAVQLTGTYLMNRNIGVNLGWAWTDQKSSGADRGPEFTVNRVLASVTLQY
jgi:hypothetical protein